MKQVYLDYSATTPVKKEVVEEMIPYFTENYGNPSSLYSIGSASKEAINEARERVAHLIGADPKEIFFTSSGTEADNWAVIGTAFAKREQGNHVITTKIEHHAMLHSGAFLEQNGFDVTYLNVDRKGRISLKELEEAITDKTILISIMFANNEVGTIQPVKEIAKIAKAHGILFHTDAVQALGNIHIDVKDIGCDLMSVSGHKIYGPKGIGALYIRKGVKINNFIHGGGQEGKKRPGTENLTGIVGFGKAAELAEKNLDEHIKRISQLRDYFVKQIMEKIDDVEINGDVDNKLPGNANMIFHYIEGEAVLLYMDHQGICASSGSACSAGSSQPSHVLTSMGIPVEDAYSSIRFTVGDMTTKEDIDYAVGEIVKVTQKLRAFSPLNRNRKMDDIVNEKK